MKSKMTLMIFFADGRTKNIPFNFATLVRSAVAIVLMLVFSLSTITVYNAYRLTSIRNERDKTVQSVTAEKRSVVDRLHKLENFEEKISFYVGGALTDHKGANLDMDKSYDDGGVGGGDETEVEDSSLDIGLPAEPEIPVQKEAEPDSSNVDLRVAVLQDRLAQLSDLAVKEKSRLDLTPSIPPVPGYVTSSFGWRRSPFTGKRSLHRGIDLVNKIGTPVRATAAGHVIFAGKEDFWGNAVFIEHQRGVVTKYGHLSTIDVKDGETVTRGEVIGHIGMTGRTTGPHVHYQIEIDEHAVDPMQFIINDSEVN